MTPATFDSPTAFDSQQHKSLRNLSDGLAAAIAVSLPWSTTATGTLVVLWLLSLIPIRDFPSLIRIVRTPAGALPIAMVALAAVGMLWADVSWSDRLQGIQAIVRLLVIPLLIAHFSRSTHIHWVLNGFVTSLTVLLVVSTIHWFWPEMPLSKPFFPGAPLHDYIVQSLLFLVAAFVLLHRAMQARRDGNTMECGALFALSLLFMTSIVAVTSGRTTYVVFPILLVLFAWRQKSFKIGAGVCLIGLIFGGIAFATSPYLQERVASISDQVRRYEINKEMTSGGFRLEFIKNSVEIVSAAPVIGHGTGSIKGAFERLIKNGRSQLETASAHPHNQLLASTIQWGAVGAVFLCAMWLAHLWLFRSGGLFAWAGFAVVAQNIVASQFNVHLSDSVMGWLYVLIVGVMGGTILQGDRQPTKPAAPIRSSD